MVFSLLFVIGAPYFGHSKHIVGGVMTYQCNGITGAGNARIVISFKMYRDALSDGAPFDNNAQIAIFRRVGNSWVFFDAEFVVPTDVKDIQPPPQGCFIIQDAESILVQEATYTTPVITIPADGSDYLAVYQRCCRTETILNLTNSGDQGAAYQLEIFGSGLQDCNSSPEFNLFPPIYICASVPLNFDHSATDIEGNELTYSFCPPKIAGGQEGLNGNGNPNSCQGVSPDSQNCAPPYDNAIFANPYSAGNPLGGSPQIIIDPQTGMITGVPTAIGQFVVGVCLEERANGELLSIVRRDFQFNVVTCDPLLDADVGAPGLKVEIGQGGGIFSEKPDIFITACGQTQITVENKSSITNFIDEYLWQFDLGNGNGFTEVHTEKQDLVIEFPGDGMYNGSLIISKDNGACNDTADIRINIFPATFAGFDFNLSDPCFAGPIDFLNTSTTNSSGIENYEWDFGDGIVEDEEDVEHIYDLPGRKNVNLLITDVNGCQDSIEQIIDYFPVPELLVVQPNKFIGCENETIQFNNLSSPLDSTYQTIWDFGDGTSSDAFSPAHEFSVPGLYDISLEVVSPNGCETERLYPNWIEIKAKPIAEFSCDPENPSVFDPEVQFTNESQEYVGHRWNISDQFISLEEDPVYSFPDTGVYEILLEVYHESGCIDTITKIIDIEPLSELIMPNAFTPNGDGKNDGFKGIGFLEGLQNYKFSIWNRWGERVFVTEDPYVSWNGSSNNSGEPAPQGVYVYVVEYISPRGETKVLEGHVTLLR